MQALKAAGNDRAAVLINEAMTNKLVAIQEGLVPNSNKAPRSARVERERMYTLAEAIEAEQNYLREMIMRGDGEESLAIAGASSEAQLRVLKGVAEGVGDGLVCLADPRSMVKGTEQLIKAGCFIVKQLGRLEAYQDALEHGDQELANRFEAEFRADNSLVVEAAAQWYESFKQLSAEEQARALSAFGTTLLFGKSIASVQMKVIGAGLNGISRGATTVANAFANHPIAMTPEGIGVAVKAAEVEGAELFATEKMASRVEKAANNHKLGKNGLPLDKRLWTEEQCVAEAARKAKGLAMVENGQKFEDFLQQHLGGTGRFIVRAKDAVREFDGAIGDIWYEAKTGDYWKNFAPTNEKFTKFKSDMGRGLRVAKEFGKKYVIYTDATIPQFVKEWLTNNGIDFIELLRK